MAERRFQVTNYGPSLAIPTPDGEWMLVRDHPEDIPDPELAKRAASYPQVEVIDLTPLKGLKEKELVAMAEEIGTLDASRKRKAELIAILEERGAIFNG